MHELRDRPGLCKSRLALRFRVPRMRDLSIYDHEQHGLYRSSGWLAGTLAALQVAILAVER
jgi:hypothetical protein